MAIGYGKLEFATTSGPRPFQIFDACQPSGVITFGDSLQYSSGCLLIQCITDVGPVLSPPTYTQAEIISAAVGGTTCADWDAGASVSGFPVGYASIIAPYFFSARTRNIAVLGCGTNDWLSGASTTTVYNHILSIVAKAKATGFSVVVGTISSSDRFTMANGGWAWRADLNSKITGGAVANGYTVFDYGNDAMLGGNTSWMDATYFTDGTHFTAAGQTIQAMYLKTALDALGVQ